MVGINRNIMGLGISRQIGQQSAKVSRIFEQLASGKRITSFDVDASGGAIATKLESVFRGLSAQITTDQSQINRLQTEESGMGGIAEELQSIRELQVQAGNDAMSDEDVASIQAEIDQRVQNIRGLAENTQFAGNPLIEVPAGSELAGIIENGIDATAGMEATDTAIEEVSAERSEIGAEVNALQSRVNERENTFINTVASFSRLSDLDIATAVSEQVNSQLRLESSVRSLRNMFVMNRQNVQRLLGNY